MLMANSTEPPASLAGPRRGERSRAVTLWRLYDYKLAFASCEGSER